jgi:hypothetical protein
MSMATKPKSEWVELIEVCSIPSPKGDFQIKFRIMASEDGEKFVFISKMRGDTFIGGGVSFKLEDIHIAREAFDAMHDAVKEQFNVR